MELDGLSTLDGWTGTSTLNDAKEEKSFESILVRIWYIPESGKI